MTRALSAPRINILMYHQVGDFPRPSGHRSTYCDHRQFARQMAFLARFGYHVLHLDEALACLRGERPAPPRAVVLTFDDGYENFYEYAWPVLQRHGFPAMVYLISGLLGQPSAWFARDGRDTPPLMSPARVRQLRAEGCDFGGHSVSHVRLATLDDATQKREIDDCKHALEDILGEEVGHFCYPYGSYDMRAVLACAEAGYRSATTCARAPATPADDPLSLPRKAIAWGHGLADYIWRLHFKNTPKRPLIRRPGVHLQA